MKNNFLIYNFLILNLQIIHEETLLLGWTLLLLVVCENKAVELVDGVDVYATYLSEDTVDNKMYVALLGIDSARTDFLQEHPILDKIIE